VVSVLDERHLISLRVKPQSESERPQASLIDGKKTYWRLAGVGWWEIRRVVQIDKRGDSINSPMLANDVLDQKGPWTRDPIRKEYRFHNVLPLKL